MVDLRHLLAIYVHAHQTGNSVPPHIDAAARAALAAEPPAPAEPDTDAVLTLAAIIREVDGNNSLGAAALAEAILAHLNAASVFQPTAPAPEAGEAEELAQWLDNKGRGAWPCPDGFSAEAEAEEYEMFSGLTRAAALLREAGAVDQKTKELITAVQVTYSAYGWVPEKHFIRLFDDVARLASALEEGCDCSIQKPLNWETEILELKARPRPVAAPTPDDFRRWWRETGSDDSGPTPEMLLTANAWASSWAARCAQPIPQPPQANTTHPTPTEPPTDD